MRVLFVCTGNVCRSPLAESILRHELAVRGVTDVEVGSAGTAALEGAPASEGSYLVGLERGLDLSAHRARQLSQSLVAEADLVLGMARCHVERARELGAGPRARLLGEIAGRAARETDVADPFGGDVAEYREAFDKLSALIAAALPAMLEERSDADPG